MASALATLHPHLAAIARVLVRVLVASAAALVLIADADAGAGAGARFLLASAHRCPRRTSTRAHARSRATVRWTHLGGPDSSNGPRCVASLALPRQPTDGGTRLWPLGSSLRLCVSASLRLLHPAPCCGPVSRCCPYPLVPQQHATATATAMDAPQLRARRDARRLPSSGAISDRAGPLLRRSILSSSPPLLPSQPCPSCWCVTVGPLTCAHLLAQGHACFCTTRRHQAILRQRGTAKQKRERRCLAAGEPFVHSTCCVSPLRAVNNRADAAPPCAQEPLLFHPSSAAIASCKTGGMPPNPLPSSNHSPQPDSHNLADRAIPARAKGSRTATHGHGFLRRLDSLH